MARPRQVGVYAAGEYSDRINGAITREYGLWNAMLNRCYNAKVHVRSPTYRLCTVEGSFLDFQQFAAWCNAQVGFKDNYELDKDLLVKGNSIYDSARCIFLPVELNLLLLKAEASRGAYPIGASLHKTTGKFRSQVSLGLGKVKSLGSYDTPLEAHLAYKKAKEVLIKRRAEEYRHVLDPRAYEALMQYQINIED
jgi:hypothetical protein